jgi:hypothetical protein
MRILLIVQPERFDFYNYLSTIPDAEWFLLWYEKPGQMSARPDQLPIAFREIYYWTQFSTPENLLETVRPDRIVFFEIIDLRQIALNVTASRKKIPTFYLEHGAAGDKEAAMKRHDETNFRKNKLPYLLKRFRNSFVDILKAKLFYYSVTKGFTSAGSYLKYFLLPFKMLSGSPNKVLHNNLFQERVPRRSIVFNHVNYEEYALYTGITLDEAELTGVPFFDRYFNEHQVIKNYIVYIDHPYYEQGILDWTKEYHEKIARTLFDFAERTKTEIYIKLHPFSDRSIWESYQPGTQYVKIVQAGDFTQLYKEAKLILGFSSSLINGFLCARKNIVLLGWHPSPHIFGSDFSRTGLCHVSLNPCDLNTKFESWCAHNLASENQAAYEKFLLQYNYPFDGKATQRVIDTILHHEIS